MGFSVSVSTAIIFAGLFLAAGILYPAMDNGMERVLDAEDDRDQAQLDLRNTAINITDAENGEITVKNTGTTSLKISEVDVIVDGEYQDRAEPENSDLWLPGEEITIGDGTGNDINVVSGSRVKVITEHGISVFTEEF